MKLLYFSTILICIFLIFNSFTANSKEYPNGSEILGNIDNNLFVENAVVKTRMVIHGRNRTNSISSITWMKGKNTIFTEYLLPAREKGKKMLRLDDKIWTYTPDPVDRIITISGHLLKQSLMGSDMSYEDMMENISLKDQYNSKVIGEEVIMQRNCWVLELDAKTKDVSYVKRKIWVDKEKWLPIKEERYAKSGKLLKKTTILEIGKLLDRWYPKKMLFKDVLSKGKGTEYYIDSIEYKDDIPKSRFTKAALRR